MFTLTVEKDGFTAVTVSKNATFRESSLRFVEQFYIRNFDTNFKDTIIPNKDNVFEAYLDPESYEGLVFKWIPYNFSSSSFINGDNNPMVKIEAFTF